MHEAGETAGALPVDLTVIEERTVGPDLGADSIRLGAIASILATLAVMAFMLITYGRFGVYANIALILNALLILGIMAIFNATLTLPGIAGFVLTIGAAVDANVLINERIREELRRGRKILDAVETGYTEASTAIFDANITNVIAAVIMFMFGTGPIRGFAVVLMIGIVTSVFTAASRIPIRRPLRSHTASSAPTFAFRPDGLHLSAWMRSGVSASRNWFGSPPARFFPIVRATIAASASRAARTSIRSSCAPRTPRTSSART